MLYVSLDDPEKNAEFATSLGATIPVLSDSKGAFGKRFGVVALGGLYSRRWTFYIDATGIVRAIDKQVKPETAGRDIVLKLGELGFPKRSTATDSTP